MKAFIFFIMIPFVFQSNQSGYTIAGNEIEFTYVGKATQSVYVSGNFNNWTKYDSFWRMSFDTGQNKWCLKLPVKDVYVNGKRFYEFTFRVDGKLTDAKSDVNKVIFCRGYGSRYVITEFE